MRTTFNDLAPSIREQVVNVLSGRLADGLDLYSQIKQAHWTIRGEGFIALHELFDKVASDVLEAVDLIAERIQQLGGSAQGTVRVSAQNSLLPEYPLTITNPRDHIIAIASVLSKFNHLLRENIDYLSALKDSVTADIFTEILRTLDKDLWFIESNQESST